MLCISEYFAALAKYPLKYRFDGLRGFHTNLRAAIRESDSEMGNVVSDLCSQLAENYEEDVVSDMTLDEYISEYLSFGGADDELERKLEDPAYVQKFRITHVYDSACDCEVPIEDVVAICPICGIQPIWVDGEGELEHGKYCGMCGADNGRGSIVRVLTELVANGSELFPFAEQRTKKNLRKLLASKLEIRKPAVIRKLLAAST